MKIPICSSLKVARKVVSKIDLPKEIARNCILESWSNGREQGLCIQNANGHPESWQKILIAEQRNSDDILVVFGPCIDFDITTNHPSDEVWKGRMNFRYDEFDKAAQFITDKIKGKI